MIESVACGVRIDVIHLIEKKRGKSGHALVTGNVAIKIVPRKRERDRRAHGGMHGRSRVMSSINREDSS